MLSEQTLSMIVPLMVLLPLVGAGLVLLAERLGTDVRIVALTNVLVTFALSVFVVAGYDADRLTELGEPQLLQMTSGADWLGTRVTETDPAGVSRVRVQGPNIRFSFGIDGISLWLIALTTLLMIPSVLVSWEAIKERRAAFYALMLLLEAGMLGVFAALDIILFYIFFEFTLIPLFFMIGLWGGYDRRWAARKFFIYTLAGSVLTFLGLLFVVLSHSWMLGSSELSFSIPQLLRDIPQLVASTAHPENGEFWHRVSPWIFLALFAGFAIKVPLFPFHTWLPLAHVEAPTAGSVLLAGVLLKIGSYGFLRFILPLVPEASWMMLGTVAVLALIGIVYGALLALAQDDIKKLVAYSSVSHMGFCLLGLFAFNAVGITGGLLQMINHGLSTGALFALVGMLYERYHTRDIQAFSGLTRKFPVMAFFFVLVVFSSIGLPGLNGFTGEVLALIGMFRLNPLYGAFGLTGIILGAWYMLWLVQRTFYGRLREPAHEGAADHAPAVATSTRPSLAIHDQHDHGQHDHDHAHGHDDHGHGHGGHSDEVVGDPSIHDLNRRELAALIPIVAVIVWIGVYPQFFVRRMEPSIKAVVTILENNRPRAAETASAAPQGPILQAKQ